MADTDAARIGDVKDGFIAAKQDANRRLRRNGSNVEMTPEEAAVFRTAIGVGGGGGSGDVVGPTGATDGQIAAFDGDTGKRLKAGPPIGVGSADSLLRRLDGDDRYRAAGDVPIAEVMGLEDALGGIEAALDAQAEAIAGKQDALGFTPADAADTYSKGEVDAALEDKADLVDGKVPAAQLPAPPTVPTFATAAEVRAGNMDGKIISPKVMADALATVVIARTDAAVGINFSTFINAQIVLDANGTLGPPSGGYPGQTGLINVSNATGSATLAFASAYRQPKGGITIEAGVNASTRIPYMIGGAGAVILFPASKWSA